MSYYSPGPIGHGSGMQSLLAATSTLGGYPYDVGPPHLYDHGPYSPPSAHVYPSEQSYHSSVSDLQRSDSKPSGLQVNTKSNANSLIAQWLTSNYEVAEGHSLPRQNVYEKYEDFCRQSAQDPINAASFGKLIRAIFPNLKTRRLGTRGNSKYHYYGIRTKPSPGGGAPPVGAPYDHADHGYGPPEIPPYGYDYRLANMNENSLAHHPPSCSTPGFPLAEFPRIDPSRFPVTVDPIMAERFIAMYHDYCQHLLDTVYRLSFEEVALIMEDFWQGFAREYTDVLKDPYMAELVGECDITTYEIMVSALIPDAIQPIKPTIIKMIRNFAKDLEFWITNTLTGLDIPALMEAKITAARQFSQALRRHTSLNHLAQAARSVLENPQQLQQMHKDWQRIDFTAVQRQTMAYCNCDAATFTTLQKDFEKLLQEGAPLETWMGWLSNIMDDVAKGMTNEEYNIKARKFLMRWSFAATLLVRDLTLRSSRSFGSFHLMRLLVDEYLVFIAERRLTRSQPAQAAAAAAVAAQALLSYAGGHAGHALGSPQYDDDLTDDDGKGPAALQNVETGSRQPSNVQGAADVSQRPTEDQANGSTNPEDDSDRKRARIETDEHDTPDLHKRIKVEADAVDAPKEALHPHS